MCQWYCANMYIDVDVYINILLYTRTTIQSSKREPNRVWLDFVGAPAIFDNLTRGRYTARRNLPCRLCARPNATRNRRARNTARTKYKFASHENEWRNCVYRKYYWIMIRKYMFWKSIYKVCTRTLFGIRNGTNSAIRFKDTIHTFIQAIISYERFASLIVRWSMIIYRIHMFAIHHRHRDLLVGYFIGCET